MQKEMQLMVLQMINASGKTFKYQYWVDELNELALIISEFRRQKLIESKNGRLILTSLGNDKFNSLSKEMNLSGIHKFISPLYKQKISKIEKDDIYLPDMINKPEI